jgi:predicted metalloprotease with PDZ domain
LESALAYWGLELRWSANPLLSESLYGLRLKTQQGSLLVGFLHPNSPAEDHLTLDDQIVAINGRKATPSNAQELLAMQQKARISFFRHECLHEVYLEPTQEQYFRTLTLQKAQTQNPNYSLWAE